MAKTIQNLADLQPDRTNANKGTQRGRGMVESSLRETGAGRSIVVDKDGRIIAGNKTLEAWADVGGEIEVVRTDGKRLVVVQREDLDLSDDAGMARKLAYYDNRAGEVGLEWDAEQLLADLNAGVDLANIFRDDELDELLAGLQPEPEPATDPGAQVDRAEELRVKWGTASGQIWQIAQHFVICGDCREPETWQRLLAAAGVDKVNGVFTSPPYAEQRKEQYGGTPAAEYVDWWEAVQDNVKANLATDGSFFVNIKAHCEDGERVLYVFDLVCAMVRQWGWRFVEELSWRNLSPAPGDWPERFKNGFEPVYQFAVSKTKFNPGNVSTVKDTAWQGDGGMNHTAYGKQAGKGKSHTGLVRPSNVIDSASSGSETLSQAAAFPVALPDFFVRAYSDKADVWLDPFCGSGTTIVAAHQNERVGLGIEFLPKYLGVILERLATATNREPVRVG